jgi:hypothetical protein
MNALPLQVTAAARTRAVMAWGAIIVALVVLVALTGHARGRAFGLRSGWPAEADTLYLPGSRAIKVMSLGHTEMAADLIAARTNVYFGTQLTLKGPQTWLARFLNAAVDMDPHLKPIYARGAAMLVYDGKEISLASVTAANDLLRRGVKAYPDEWDLWFQLGFNLAFELPKLVPRDDPRAKAWKKEGLEYLRRSTLFEGIAPHIASLVARMMTDQGERELAIRHLEQSFAVTSDPLAREQIRNKLTNLIGLHYSQSFDREVGRLGRVTETRYPYAAESFSLLAGPRIPAIVDPAWSPAEDLEPPLAPQPSPAK